MKLELSENTLVMKSLLNTSKLDVNKINRAYMRIEEVSAKVCCGRANFDRFFLMLKTSEKDYKLELDSKDLVEKYLERIKLANPNVAIGKA